MLLDVPTYTAPIGKNRYVTDTIDLNEQDETRRDEWTNDHERNDTPDRAAKERTERLAVSSTFTSIPWKDR